MGSGKAAFQRVFSFAGIASSVFASFAICIPVSAAVSQAKSDGPLPGIVFVSGNICNPDPTKGGKYSTRYWREGYIYHRATSLDPIERTMTPTRPGRNLYTLVPATPEGKLTRITHLTDGQVFDPEPSYDGKTILFSMRRDGEDWFHLCEIDADGGNPVQLTDGPFNDVSGVYLPDGRIVFVSDRAGYLEEYHEERTETLWIMNGDGTGIRQLTFDPGTPYDPTILADGRICFSYWDVFMIDVPPIDKHETYLMTIRPDGTEQTHLFGARQYEFFNRERHSGFSVTQAGQMPNGTLLVLSEMGPSIIDLTRGVTVSEALWPVFPGTTSLQLGGATHRVHLSPIGSRTTPYPLPDGRFLLAATLPGARDLGIYVCDPATRDMRLVFNDPETSEYDARPILQARPRPKQLPNKPPLKNVKNRFRREQRQEPFRKQNKGIPSGTAQKEADEPVSVTGHARFLIVNPRQSDNPEHRRVLRQARYYRVIEAIHTAVTSSSHTNQATRILGVVPIPRTSPILFDAPADAPLFLEALDAAGNRILFDWNYPVTSVPMGSKQALVEMSTFSGRPGATTSCHGCHAPHAESVPSQLSGLPHHAPIRLERDVMDSLYRRNEPDEYRTAARVGEASKYRAWLTDANPERRRLACLLLMAIEDGARQDAPRIAQLLKHVAPTSASSVSSEPIVVRRAAALALTRLGTLDEAPTLVAALSDVDWQVRFHAASALEAMTGSAPADPVNDAAIRKYYETLLAEAGGIAGLKDLVGGKSGPEMSETFSGGTFSGSRFEAIGRLGPSAPESARQIIRRTLAGPLPPASQFAPQVGKQRFELIGKPPPVAAMRAAGWVRDIPSIPRLVPWLVRHDYNYHATEAALALGRIGTDEAITALWRAVHSEVPNRRVYISRYLQHGPRPEEYSLLRGLVLANAVPKLEDVPFLIAMLPGTFLEKPRYEDRLRPESQRILLVRLLLERANLRRRAVRLLTDVLRADGQRRIETAPRPPVGQHNSLYAVAGLKCPDTSFNGKPKASANPAPSRLRLAVKRGHHKPAALYNQILEGINLERPFAEHGRTFPVIKQIEPEQALWLLGCLVPLDEQTVPVTVHETNAVSASARGQAHFSATALSPEYANTRRKMSQTPACERLAVPDELVVPYLTSPNWRERIDAAVLLNRQGFGRRAAARLASEVGKPYPFREILSIGKGRPEPNFRDKCYLLVALAHHTDQVELLRAFADPKARYRDIRYGLALGLGYRGKPDGIDLLIQLATQDPVTVVRRQARESLRFVQQTQRLAGKPMPHVKLPNPISPDQLYPPRPIKWPNPAAMPVKHSDQQNACSLEELKEIVADGLKSEHYRNLNNTNNQAPGATRMMISDSARLADAVQELIMRHGDAAKSESHQLLDSPYPFAHYIALRSLADSRCLGWDSVLLAKLDTYAKATDTVGFYWTCEALAHCQVSGAVARLIHYTQPESWIGLHGPSGMGFGYPAAKAIAHLAADATRPEVVRLLEGPNVWLRAGTIAGLCESDALGVADLLARLQRVHPPAVVRAEIAVSWNRLRIATKGAAKTDSHYHSAFRLGN